MSRPNTIPQIPLPKAWSTQVKSAVVHVIALAQYALIYSRSWAAVGSNQRVRPRAECDRLEQEAALMSASEVTIGQFQKFAAATGYQTEAEKAEAAAKAAPPPVEAGQPPPKPIETYINPGYVTSDDLPAAFITWNDAVAYCQWLSTQEKAVYRLPTEAEWEYACRAGTTTQYSFGDDVALLDQYGWYTKNAGGKSHPVGTKLPNGFGLFDMHGNLNEWCSDFYEEKWYEKSLQNDPNGPVSGSDRVIRGGGWAYFASLCRSAYRTNFSPSLHHNHPGFRIVQELAAPSTTASVTPQPAVPAASSTKPITDFNSPEFLAWMKEVQAMPADEQVKAVSKKLMELNPGFGGKEEHEIDGDQVISFRVVGISDISPVRALPHLKLLACAGDIVKRENRLDDLSSLQGMKLEELYARYNGFSDLSPLLGMPLQKLDL